MKSWEQDRRDFLKMLAALPVLYLAGCGPGKAPVGKYPLQGPDESLRKLIRLLGPWKEEGAAGDFIRRFLGAEDVVAPYLADRGASIGALAARFPDTAMAADSVDLRGVPEEEKELLLELTKQLYTFIEIRFLVAGEPPWGECGPEDRLRYTRAPE